MAFGLPELPSVGSALGSLAGAALTALLQRTYFIQTQTPDGIPRPLLVIDSVHEEDPTYTADVTQHPVEAGPEVSDHIQLKNPTLRIKGVISNTPLDLSVSIGNLVAGGISAITSSQARSNLLNTGLQQGAGLAGAAIMGNAGNVLSAGLAGAADALARTTLLALIQNKVPFDVVTKRQKYSNMVVQSLRMPRDQSTGYAVVFEIELIQLRVVSPLQVQLTQLDESVISSATPSTNLGGQTTQAASDSTSKAVNGSWLRKLVGG